MGTLWGLQATAQRPSEGTLILGMPFTLTAALFNPTETTGLTASLVHYALHDVLLKPLPGQPMAPALAESWTESPDGRTYEFTLRPGLTFPSDDPFTAEDVTFSFGRHKGVFATLLHEKVQAVESVAREPAIGLVPLVSCTASDEARRRKQPSPWHAAGLPGAPPGWAPPEVCGPCSGSGGSSSRVVSRMGARP